MLVDLCPGWMFSSIVRARKSVPQLGRSRSKLRPILCRLRTKLHTKLCTNFGRSRARLCPISFAFCPFPNLAGTLVGNTHDYYILCVTQFFFNYKPHKQHQCYAYGQDWVQGSGLGHGYDGNTFCVHHCCFSSLSHFI